MQAKLIANIAPYLTGDKVSWKRVMNLLKSMHNDGAKLIALKGISQYLREMPALLNQTILTASLLANVKDRTEVLIALAEQMNDKERYQLLKQIHKDIKNAEKINGFDAELSFLPCLQVDECFGILERAILYLESQENPYRYASDLEKLAPYLKGFPNLAARAFEIAMKINPFYARMAATAIIVRENPELMNFTVWIEWFRQSPSDREELLNTMDAFVFGASQLTGIQEAPEIARAILDVGKWWP